MSTAPHIVVCVPATEQAFGARVAQLLTKRGLRVTRVSAAPQIQQVLPCAAICVALGANADDEALVDAAIEAHCPIFPLLLRSGHSLPSVLEQTQWSDFRQNFWSGWRDLLLALDVERLSRWPPDREIYDADLVLARAQNGLTPPDWQVYRGFAHLQRRFTMKTLLACLAVIILSLPAWLITPGYWIAYLVAGGFFLLGAADSSRFRLWSYLKNGPMIVITPDGFVNLTTTGVDAFAFAQLRAIERKEVVVTRGRKKTTITRLHITRNTGARQVVTIPTIYDTRLTPFLYPAPRRSRDIAERIIAAFHQTKQPLSSIAYSGQRPLVFLSYAHRDERMVQTLEIALRGCGMEPWVDRSRLKVGRRWEEEIKAAIGQCAALVLLISPAAVKSSYIDKEIARAKEYQKPIIGIVIRRCPTIPESWRRYIKGEVRFRQGGLHDVWPLLYALDQAGVLPEGMRTQREQGAHFVLARAMAQAPLPDEQVFAGRRTNARDTLIFLGISIALAVAAPLLSPPLVHALKQTPNVTLALIPLLVTLLYEVSLLVFGLWWSWLPDNQELIVIFPTGIAHNIRGRVSAAAFLPSDDWRIKRSSIGGTVCQLAEKRLVAIPSRFRHHRQIAQRMIEAFQRSQGRSSQL
jgi:TIR domain